MNIVLGLLVIAVAGGLGWATVLGLRQISHRVLWAAIVFAQVSALPGLAWADASSSVDLAPALAGLHGYLVEIATALAIALLGVLVRWVQSHTNLQIAAADRDLVRAAVTNGIDLAAARLGIFGRSSLTVDLNSRLAASATRYVLDQMPDALKRLGMPADELGRYVESQIAAALGAPEATPPQPDAATGGN
ncbi:MAG: hypothetical protein GC168_20555 [Candidatus Hydrogenedens sp.]|nr:hypothetical protein [Candidatus Hydrogenedens sp.]